MVLLQHEISLERKLCSLQDDMSLKRKMFSLESGMLKQKLEEGALKRKRLPL